MELFGTLMRVGTTIETARVLGISQASVSAQLKRLEGRIGFRLFHRTGNRLEPTAEAHRLFEEAAPIFATHTQIRSRLVQLAAQAGAPVSVSATPAVVEGWLAPRLASAGFRDWRNRLHLRVTEPEVDVRRGLADLGLMMAVPPKAEFVSYRPMRVPLYAVMRRDCPLAGRDALSVSDLGNHALVCYNPATSPMGLVIQDTFKAAGIRYDPACVVPFSSTVCTLVEACGGIGIIDALTVGRLTSRALVTARLVDAPEIGVALFHRREPLSAPVQDLLHHLLDDGSVVESSGG